jgi:hypothetical protein
MKKNTLFVTSALCIVLFAIGCKNADADHASAQKDTARTADTLTRRDALIAALKDLHTTIASRDKQRIAALFEFPVPESVIPTFVDDSMYNVAYEKNDRLLTDTLFNKYFKAIAEVWSLDEFGQVFKYVDVDQLRKKDSLTHEVAANGAVRQYELENVRDSLIAIRYGVSHTDSEEGGEYLISWFFLFDGRRLKVIGRSEAD